MVEENLNFYFSFYTFTIKLKDQLEFYTYPGNVLRGAVGYTLKKICCITKNKDCTNCLLRNNCVYVYLFESFTQKKLPNFGATKDLPRPFVIEIADKKVYQPHEELQFNLLLFGKATDYIPYFILTFEQLSETGLGKKYKKAKFELVKITNFKNEVVYLNEEKIFKDKNNIIHTGDVLKLAQPYYDKTELTLNFLSPIRIKQNNKLVKNLEFHTLFRALYRRVAAIMYFYCDKEPNFDYKLLTTKSKNVKIKLDNLCWYDWERYSTRQKTKMKLGGLIGKITYQSEETFNLFLPFLTIGQYTHIGKNCTFGLGRYEIENVVI